MRELSQIKQAILKIIETSRAHLGVVNVARKIGAKMQVRVTYDENQKEKKVAFSLEGVSVSEDGMLVGIIHFGETIEKAIYCFAKGISEATLKNTEKRPPCTIKVPDLFAESEIPEK